MKWKSPKKSSFNSRAGPQRKIKLKFYPDITKKYQDMDSIPLPMDIISHIRQYVSHPVADMVRDGFMYVAWYMVDFYLVGFCNRPIGLREYSEMYDTYQEAYGEYLKYYNDDIKISATIVRRLNPVKVCNIIKKRMDENWYVGWGVPGAEELNIAGDERHPPKIMEHEYTNNNLSKNIREQYEKYDCVECSNCGDGFEKGSEEHGKCRTNGDELYCEYCQTSEE
tara:strand:- start:32 stop:703 length:672 start_codon:yes stop_codon:yes gene_type:complete